MGSDFTGKPVFHSIFSMMEESSPSLASVFAQMDILGETSFAQMDVRETGAEITVEVDLPGMDASGIDVMIQGGWLIVEGMKKEDPEKKDGINFLCLERSFGPVRRFLKLPAPVDAASARGVYKDGVLAIRLPKREERRNKARKISIEKP
ncbi:MAG: Hsp20/alpha crystallin family protein [Candidatus Nitrospinota bacterium M3_3B_026]